MGIALISVGLVAVIVVIIRVAVGFLRWARANSQQAGLWAVATYLRDSLGNWVDGVNDSGHWSSSEVGSHHHSDGAHHHDAGFHSGGDGGHGGDF
jgi:hypothetical protein